ncbi:hypothetical protein ACVEIK_025450 (plasmid) [Klebsiella aerogenes]|nr:hypothetical protein [Klebsiella pneumoniae]EKW0455538.1 hypothetical protein [Klebsiella pneumoniae]ELB4096354.1 hypothetical protein [Klebsiella pneumoniae]ELB5502035.1 hypothetical protein [Klebsiella oxytoca]
MTDIARLINSIKRRTSSARELGYDVLFVALDDLDVLADSLETALRANAAQAAHIEQLQDIKHQLESKLAKPVAEVTGEEHRQLRDLVMMVKMLCRTVRKYNPKSQQAADFIAYLQKEGLISVADCLRDSDPLDTETEDRRG